MISVDRLSVSRDGAVLCPLRDSGVSAAECLVCQRLVRAGGELPPAYVVCDARRITGWLGMDPPV